MNETVPLKRIARFRYGDALPAPERSDGEYPVVGSGGISGTHNQSNASGPVIVVGRKGSYGSITWMSGPCFVIDTAYAVQPADNTIDHRWLYYVLRAVDLKGVSQDVGVPGLSREAVTAVRVPDPPSHEEQRRIADRLDAETAELDRLASVQKRLLAVLHERREASIYTEVTGSAYVNRRPSGLAWARSLPSHWSTIKLGLLARMGSGHTPSRLHPEWWVDCKIPWITTGEVAQVRDDRRETINQTRERISALGLANSAAELHPKGTVVLCRTASAGYSAVMGTDMATSQDFVTWTCGPRLNPFYLLWCLRAMRQDLIGRLAMGSTHKTIYVPDLQMIRIPVPEPEEQRVIVARIRERNAKIDQLIDVITDQLALLTEKRCAVITSAVNGGLGAAT